MDITRTRSYDNKTNRLSFHISIHSHLIADLLSAQELLDLRLFPHAERALLLLGRTFLRVGVGVLGAVKNKSELYFGNF